MSDSIYGGSDALQAIYASQSGPTLSSDRTLTDAIETKNHLRAMQVAEAERANALQETAVLMQCLQTALQYHTINTDKAIAAARAYHDFISGKPPAPGPRAVG